MNIEVKTVVGLSAVPSSHDMPAFGKAKAQFMQQLEGFARKNHEIDVRGHLAGALTDGRTWYLARFEPHFSSTEKHKIDWTVMTVTTPAECDTLVNMLVAMIVAKVAVAGFLGTMFERVTRRPGMATFVRVCPGVMHAVCPVE